jgi:hypothetical protein
MSWDLAIDFGTGDLVWTGNNDFGSRGGSDVDKQRIHVRLFIERGEFLYDPTHGGLGSRLLDVTHLPRDRAIIEAPLYVREALSSMEDVEITNVQAVEQEDPTVLKLEISYKPTFDIGEESMPEETIEENVIVEIPT